MATISEQEKFQRTQQVESVLGTHAMEGIKPDAVTIDLLRQYQSGDLSLDELSSALDSHAMHLVATHQQFPVVA